MKNVASNSPTNHDRQGSTGGNRRLAQWRVTWLIEHSTSHQLLWFIDSFELRNPPLRQAPNRYNCERKHQSLDYQTPEKLFKKIV